MLSLKSFLTISSVLFGFIALIHLIRAVAGLDLMLGTFNLPLPASWIAFLILGYMSVVAARLVGRA